MKHAINSIAIAGLAISIATMTATSVNELTISATIVSAFVLLFSDTISEALDPDDK